MAGERGAEGAREECVVGTHGVGPTGVEQLAAANCIFVLIIVDKLSRSCQRCAALLIKIDSLPSRVTLAQKEFCVVNKLAMPCHSEFDDAELCVLVCGILGEVPSTIFAHYDNLCDRFQVRRNYYLRMYVCTRCAHARSFAGGRRRRLSGLTS